MESSAEDLFPYDGMIRVRFAGQGVTSPTQREEPPVKREEPARPEPKQTEEPQQELPLPKVPDYRIIGEALNTYILVEQAGSLLSP